MHGALAFETGEDLILVVTVHVVMVARVGIVMHPGMQLAGVHHHRALLFTQRNLLRVDDLNPHRVSLQTLDRTPWWHSSALVNTLNLRYEPAAQNRYVGWTTRSGRCGRAFRGGTRSALPVAATVALRRLP